LSEDARITGLVRQLGSKDWEVASEAQRALVRVGRTAVPPLCDLLEGEDSSAAWRAAWVLGRIWDRRAVEPLCRVLEKGYENAPFTHITYSEAGRRAARDQHAMLRVEVTDALRLLRDPASVGPLCDALEDPYFNVRRNAAKALIEIGPAAAPELATRLSRLPNDSAIHAAEVLGSAGDERCIDPLCGILAKGPFTLRLAAAKALQSLAKRCPASELRAAIPELKRLASPWTPVPDELQKRAIATLRLIESVTQELKTVPRPAAPPHADISSLPRPVSELELPFTLPRLDGPETQEPAGSPLLRRLRSLLRGGDAE